MDIKTFDRPREKLLKRGVSSLSDSELLQLVIGSGTARFPVTRIARKVLSLIKKKGSGISYEELHDIQGLGLARISLILALFEIAGRYPVKQLSRKVDSLEQLLLLFSTHRTLTDLVCIYVTLDGGLRVIAKRKVLIADQNQHYALLRSVCVDAMSDGAAGVAISFVSSDRLLEPTHFELQFTKDLTAITQLLILTIHCLFTMNANETYSLKKELRL